MNRLTYPILLSFILIVITSCARNAVQDEDVFGSVVDDPVRSAIKDGDSEKLKTALAEGADYKTADIFGLLPVHLAAQTNNVAAMKLLKRYKADIKALDSKGNQPIHIAAIANARDVLFWLVKDQKISLDTLNVSQETPTQTIISNGKYEGLATMVEMGIDIHQADASGDTLLHEAVLAYNPGAVSQLLELNAEPYSFNSRGYAPLHLSAISARQSEVLGAFKDYGVDMNYPDASGDLAIHLSIRSLAIDSQSRLIELGADLSAPDKNGLDVMTLAVKANNANGIAILHSAGIAIDDYNIQGYASVHQAVVLRRKASLESLLNLGANTEQPVQDKGTTALHLSARLGYTIMQDILQKSGADVNAKDNAGNTAAHYAARFNKSKSIKLARSGGTDINARNYNGQTPIHVAITFYSHAAIAELLKSGADITIRNFKGNQPLHTAIRVDNSVDVRALLNKGADLESLNGEGLSPLFQSVLSGDASNVANIIKAGAQIHATDSNGLSAIHRAADAGRAKSIVVLVKGGQAPDVVTPNGDTALHLAARKNRILALRALARVGANIDGRNKNGDTPMHAAISEDAGESVRELLDLGANIQLRDDANFTPLLRAVVDNKPESAKLLMKQDPRGQRDLLGNTPILLSMKMHNDAMTSLLLRLGASASEANFDGENPLALALKRNHYQLAELLANYGADVTEPLDSHGNNACDLTADSAWRKSCMNYFRDHTYLSARQRWVNLGQPNQYLFSKWFKRIPRSIPKAKDSIAAIREQADFKMRYYLAFSDPDHYLTSLSPPEEPQYSIERIANESDQAYFERLDYIKTNYQNDYRQRLLKYENTKKHRLEEIASFKSYHGNELPSRSRVAVDINTDAVQSHLRKPLRATLIDHDIVAGVLRLQLSSSEFTINLSLHTSQYESDIDYLAKYGYTVAWYMGAAIDSEFFTITHIIVPTSQGYTYILLDKEEYKYLLQRFISLGGQKTYSETR